MSRREKIMLFMALGAIVYGLLQWVVFSPEKPPAVPVAEKTDGSEKVAGKLMAKIMNMEIEHPHKKEIIAKIETPWERDPFVQPGPQAGSSAVTSGGTVTFVPDLRYSGFIVSGERAMAIIDGNEYFVGDTVVDTNYQVIRITPDKVVIQKDQNTGEIFFYGD